MDADRGAVAALLHFELNVGRKPVCSLEPHESVEQISGVQAANESEEAFNAPMKTSLSVPASGSSQRPARRFSSAVSTLVKRAPDAGRR